METHEYGAEPLHLVNAYRPGRSAKQAVAITRKRCWRYPQVGFTFLGFTFRPRRAKSQQGRHFTSFLPAASEVAMRRMRQAVRRWRLTRQTHVTLAETAKLYNPVIQGWWNYYGVFYQTAMQEIFQHIDRALGRWVRRKFKILSGRSRRSATWLGKMRDAYPRLFCHWYVNGLRVG